MDSCFYTLNDNENFILDFHPFIPNIIFGGGFSGHGFKFAPLIGKILTELVLTGETHYNISKFKI
jgi:glycine/D-amino acid oxidase-like deaminating enzyme